MGNSKNTSELIKNQDLQKDLLQTVSEEISISKYYILLLVFSTLIAVLGLIIDSAAVVIGAMLISPLFWPILGLSLSIITTKQHLAGRSAISLGFSILVVLAIGFFTTKISPISGETQEIISRTTPTLLDLGIALAASVLGVLAIYHPKISRSTSGVAISISLLPPLCVTGIGLALGSWSIVFGSFLLFASNAGAIVFVGAITLYLLNFRPIKKDEKIRLRYGLLSSFAFLFLLSIPLTYILVQTINQNHNQTQINQLLRQEIKTLNQDAQIDEVTVRHSPLFSNQPINIRANILLPENTLITQTQQNQILDKLDSQLKKDFRLQLHFLNTVNLLRDQDEAQKQLISEIENLIDLYLTDLKILEQKDALQVSLPTEKSNIQDIQVSIILKESSTNKFNYLDKIKLEQLLKTKFNNNFVVDIEFLPIRKLSQFSELDRFKNQVNGIVVAYSLQINQNIQINNIELTNPPSELLTYDIQATSSAQVLGISNASILIDMSVPEDFELPQNFNTNLKDQLESETGVEFNLEIHLNRFEIITI